MSLLLLRNPNILKNVLDLTFRKRKALSFRKTLGVFNYKVKPNGYYKNPHGMNLHLKEFYKKEGGDAGQRKIRAIEGMSLRPFGTFTRKSRFAMEKNRIPLYNIQPTLGFRVNKVYINLY